MKPPAFDLVLATDLDEALAALAHYGDEARILAGGQSLMPMLNMRLLSPSALIDLSNIDALSYIREDGGFVEVGAGVTQAALQRWERLPERAPLLARALPHVGHWATRNRGTVCGSLCHADPSAELPLCLAVLDGEVVLRSARGQRVLKASEFQTGMLSTARRPDELVVAARFRANGAFDRFAFREVARRHGDFAIVGLAAAAAGHSVRLGLAGVAARPELRDWRELARQDLDDALNELAWSLDVPEDLHASARYRREIIRRAGRQAIEAVLPP